MLQNNGEKTKKKVNTTLIFIAVKQLLYLATFSDCRTNVAEFAPSFREKNKRKQIKKMGGKKRTENTTSNI